MANAGVAAQLPLVGGNPAVMERTLQVNVMGVYNTLRAAGPHISHPRGYALPVSSLAAAVHAPLLGAYSASKAAVEALGNTLASSCGHGARAGVAYFAELDTDMTRRGFGTAAAGTCSSPRRGCAAGGGRRLARAGHRPARAACRRARWFRPVLPVRMAAQPRSLASARRVCAGARDRAERRRPAHHQPAGGRVLTQARVAPGSRPRM